jgi:hypothetical protein
MPAGSRDGATIAQYLSQHTEVLEAMLGKLNLSILGYSYLVGDGYMITLVLEFAAIEGSSLHLPDDNWGCYIKANVYDESGTIMATETTVVQKDSFTGYDTASILFYVTDIGLYADRVRIFATPY